MSQHLPVFQIKTFTEVVMFHLFHVVWLDPSFGTLTGVSALAAKDYLELCYVLTQFLLEGIEFFAEINEHHYNTIVFI